jgi:hypothetical protein
VRLSGGAVRHAVTLVVAAGAFSLLVPSSVARADCVGPPSPSQYAFMGTVIDTEERGRVATVITDQGQTLTVLGTRDRSWLTNSYTSVDRRYALGGRYAFHPRNSDPPFQDDACSATRQLAGPRLQAPEPSESAGFLPKWLPVDEQAGPIGYLLFFGPLAAGILFLVVVARKLRRRRRIAPGRGSRGPVRGVSADTPRK